MSNKNVKEPIRKKWIWIVMIIILLGNVPWYFSVGSYKPLILGIPYWGFIIIIFSLILSAYLSWLCIHQWNIVEDEEESDKGGEE